MDTNARPGQFWSPAQLCRSPETPNPGRPNATKTIVEKQYQFLFFIKRNSPPLIRLWNLEWEKKKR